MMGGTLPSEIWSQIISHLSTNDLKSTSATSSMLQLLSLSSLWNHPTFRQPQGVHFRCVRMKELKLFAKWKVPLRNLKMSQLDRSILIDEKKIKYTGGIWHEQREYVINDKKLATLISFLPSKFPLISLNIDKIVADYCYLTAEQLSVILSSKLPISRVSTIPLYLTLGNKEPLVPRNAPADHISVLMQAAQRHAISVINNLSSFAKFTNISLSLCN